MGFDELGLLGLVPAVAVEGRLTVVDGLLTDVEGLLTDVDGRLTVVDELGRLTEEEPVE